MYGLIGYPLGHSFSAGFFNDKFKNEGIDEHYNLFPIEHIDVLPELLKKHPDLKGLNVTIPYKEKVIPFLAAISDDAKEIGAVNVIAVSDNGKTLKGFNTDAIGFRESLLPLLKPEMNKALVLGTGGASKAVAYVLKKLGIEVRFVSRHEGVGYYKYEDLTPEVIAENRIIVNTTPLGMWPNTEACPDLPYSSLSDSHLCYDLVYNPEITTFMRKSAEMGATVKNGLEMLHRQALAAWDIWNN